jgi:hypothetical protein
MLTGPAGATSVLPKAGDALTVATGGGGGGGGGVDDGLVGAVSGAVAAVLDPPATGAAAVESTSCWAVGPVVDVAASEPAEHPDTTATTPITAAANHRAPWPLVRLITPPPIIFRSAQQRTSRPRIAPGLDPTISVNQVRTA